MAISATSHNGKSAVCYVKVCEPLECIYISSDSAKIKRGDTFQLLVAMVHPPTFDVSALKWSSSDPNVASVDQSGLVTAIAPGNAVIAVESTNGKKATCEVLVYVPCESVGFTRPYLNLVTNDTAKLKVEMLPLEATEEVWWDSSNTKIVTVDKSGGVTAGRKSGMATITAHTTSGKTAECSVKVATKTKLVNAVKGWKAKLLSVSANDKGEIEVELGNLGRYSGFQVQYSNKSNMKRPETISTTDSVALFKELEAGKTYYFRIRVYEEIRDKMYYGKWSAKKKIKIS